MKIKINEKITKIVEKWYMREPLFFTVWTLHSIVENYKIKTIRTGSGKVEYNPEFLKSLDDNQLYEVFCFEAMRIVLKHPYNRKREIDSLSYLASNITIQEYTESSLGFQNAKEVFKTDKYKLKYYEFYYEKLLEKAEKTKVSDINKGEYSPSSDNNNDNGLCDSNSKGDIEKNTKFEGFNEKKSDQNNKINSNQNIRKSIEKFGIEEYTDEKKSGIENTKNWESDEFFEKMINLKIEEAQQNNSWGIISGNCKSNILATMKPKLDYRAILISFRASVLSTKRHLTRMKPSRRYSFLYMGSKRDFTTKLLFAVDVSGSVSNNDLRKAFSIVNRFFKYGIESVDVICFDSLITTKPLSLKKAQKTIQIKGRGGTCFQAVIDFIDEKTQYDGLIIFTDGIAPTPSMPKNRKTRIVWLFNTKKNYKESSTNLSKIGLCAYVKDS